MRWRLYSVVLFCSSLLAAGDGGITIKQLTEFIQSSKEQKYPDKLIAQQIAHMKLSERLDERGIETLQGLEIGPKTLEALHQLSTAASSLATAAPAPRVNVDPPRAPTLPDPPYEEQQDAIREMTDYALNYTKRLPNFICTQVTRRFIDPRGRDSWIGQDTVISKLSYLDGHENYEVKLVNNSIAENKTMDQLGGAVSTGEFGSLMQQVFDPLSAVEFHFERWGTLRGSRSYVFSYEIEQGRSKYSIDWDRKRRIVTAYKGLVYWDKKSHAITRITAEAVNIPPDFPVRSTSTRLDYEQQTIGTRDFLVPMVAEVRMRDAEVAIKNTIEFRSYRVFGTETNIKYEDEATDPVDPSKLKEEKPK